MTDWNTRFMALAHHIASWSKDRSTQVGAVIVGPHREIRATGYNGFPPGLDDRDDTLHERPAKYFYMAHAERNALDFALLTGARVEGCTLYTTMFPCADCARGIVRAGISQIVAYAPSRLDWAASHAAARRMFTAAGVSVVVRE